MTRWQYSEINTIMQVLDRLTATFDDEAKTADLVRISGIPKNTMAAMWTVAGQAVDILNDILTATDDDNTPLPRKYKGWTRPGQN